MQLSLYADYSCRTLMYLATKTGDQKSSIEEISQAYGISANHLMKVVHRLGQLGYIETSRGRGGGIRLAKDPQDIRLGEVIRKTEISFDLVECFNPETNSCRISLSCGLKPILRKAMAAFIEVLDEVSLDQIIANGMSFSPLKTKNNN